MKDFLIDTHCHLESDEYADRIGEILNNAVKNNIQELVCIGTDLKTSIEAVNLANKFKNVYAVIGIFPEYAKKEKSNLEEIKKLCNNKKVIAIGEVGFDFHLQNKSDCYEDQKEIFIKQIEIANEFNLPLVIHSRDAYEETLDIMRSFKVNKKGVFHCFSYSYEFFEVIKNLGFLVGFDGPITFKNAEHLRDIVKKIPLESIVLETDSPFLTPEPFRGHINEPANLIYIAKKMSEIKQTSLDEVISITTNNFRRVFLNGK